MHDALPLLAQATCSAETAQSIPCNPNYSPRPPRGKILACSEHDTCEARRPGTSTRARAPSSSSGGSACKYPRGPSVLAHFSTATFKPPYTCQRDTARAAALPNLPAELVVAALFPVCFLALGAAVARLAAAAAALGGRGAAHTGQFVSIIFFAAETSLWPRQLHAGSN